MKETRHFESPQEAQALLEQLLSLDATPCGFLHEKSNKVQPILCPEDVQERHLGCAHAGNSILNDVISACLQHGLVPEQRARELRLLLDETYKPLLQLDLEASAEYETGKVHHSTLEGQRTIINGKEIIRNELVRCIRSAQKESHSA